MILLPQNCSGLPCGGLNEKCFPQARMFEHFKNMPLLWKAVETLGVVVSWKNCHWRHCGFAPRPHPSCAHPASWLLMQHEHPASAPHPHAFAVKTDQILAKSKPQKAPSNLFLLVTWSLQREKRTDTGCISEDRPGIKPLFADLFIRSGSKG